MNKDQTDVVERIHDEFRASALDIARQAEELAQDLKTTWDAAAPLSMWMPLEMEALRDVLLEAAASINRRWT